MNPTRWSMIAVTLTFVALGASGCATSQPDSGTGALPSKATAPAASSHGAALKSAGVASESPRSKQQQNQSSLDALRRGQITATGRGSAMGEVYFEFDRYDLDNRDRATLRANADWLKKNPSVRVAIEGHCDERGTNEYNLALGAKRAQAAVDYLLNLGIAPERLTTISYGEEIPVCREQSEGCRQRNRRDRFVVTQSRSVFGQSHR